jgi:CheY-like chemotaxis protein
MRTVLIADSDSFQRQLIDMLLAVDNYHLLGFETGKALLEHLQSHVPDLVILDYALPDINGADLCAKMRKVKRLANVPVILITAAHKLELVRGVAAAVRADLVLAKPLGDKHLRENVLKLLRPVETTPQATPIHLDPVLEQALETIQTSASQSLSPLLSSPHLPPVFLPTEVRQSHTSERLEHLHQDPPNKITPVFLDRDEDAPYHLEVSDAFVAPSAPPKLDWPPKPLNDVQKTEDIQRISAFQEDANAALEALLGESGPSNGERESKQPNKNPQQQHLWQHTSDEAPELADTDGAISEQELLASLSTPLSYNETAEHVLEVESFDETFHDPTALIETGPQLKPPPLNDTPAPENPLEPQAFTLGTKPPEAVSLPTDFNVTLDETVSGIEAELQSLRAQVQQLSDENERLRSAFLELEQGQSLVSSKSYLDAIEELELLRRLSNIQVKQLDSLQRQNQRLMEEAHHSQERKRGLFGFLQPKNPSS